MKKQFLHFLEIQVLLAFLLLSSCSKSVNGPKASQGTAVAAQQNSYVKGDVLTGSKQQSTPASLNSTSPEGNATVNGGGTTVEGGLKSTFVFNAVRHADGSVNGHLVYQFRGGNLRLMLNITCMTITGNRATLYGTVDAVSGTNIPTYIFVGQKAIFSVVDNGQGNAAQPDQISDVILGSGVSCGEMVTTYLPVSGNIHIKG